MVDTNKGTEGNLMRVVKNKLSANDAVIASMLCFPKGMIGEKGIHDFIFNLTKLPEFSYLYDEFKFQEINGFQFSIPIHTVIEDNSKDVTNSGTHGESIQTPISSAIFSDSLRFEQYDEVMKTEGAISTLINNYTPKVYYLTAPGKSIAIRIIHERMNSAQKRIFSEFALF
jgi:hypothetical protein